MKRRRRKKNFTFRHTSFECRLLSKYRVEAFELEKISKKPTKDEVCKNDDFE